MAEVYTLHIDAGTTWRIEFEYTNEDETVFDLTGYTAEMQLRETPDAALALSLDATIDIELGRLAFIASAEETSSLTLPTYAYAVELTNGTEVIRLVQGSAHVNPEVVR
jgi:hypothetical protein